MESRGRLSPLLARLCPSQALQSFRQPTWSFRNLSIIQVPGSLLRCVIWQKPHHLAEPPWLALLIWTLPISPICLLKPALPFRSRGVAGSCRAPHPPPRPL